MTLDYLLLSLVVKIIKFTKTYLNLFCFRKVFTSSVFFSRCARVVVVDCFLASSWDEMPKMEHGHSRRKKRELRTLSKKINQGKYQVTLYNII